MTAAELEAAVAAGGLLRPAQPVVVMLSGGRDSTALLDLSVRITGPDRVCALHVNYGLRAGADMDERHCMVLCQRLGVPLHVRRPEGYQGGNLQAWARTERYQAAVRLAGTGAADVAAGHTATDQVETILYRLASSPSRRALLGMREREGVLIRPLLGFTREQTAAYCVARNLAWREDESNDSSLFARGRTRNGLVPALRALHPGAERNVLALAAILRQEAEVLDDLVDEVLGGARQVELERLRQLPEALRRLVVQRLADDAAGGPAPGAARRANEIVALSNDAALDLPHGVRALVTRGTLRLVSREARVDQWRPGTGDQSRSRFLSR